MLIRRHLIIKIINPVLSEIFDQLEADKFLELDARECLNIEEDGKKYAILYEGDTEERPFIPVPNELDDVRLLISDWMMLDEISYHAGPVKLEKWHEDTDYRDVIHNDVWRIISNCWDEIEAGFSYVFVEGYRMPDDHQRFRSYEKSLGHDIFEYDARIGGDGSYFTEPVPKDSPYYMGESGGPGFMTLKINNSYWWPFDDCEILSDLFREGCGTTELDPQSKNGQYRYKLVLKDVPLEHTYCPQNIWEFQEKFKDFVEANALIYPPEEQKKAFSKYYDDPYPEVVDFWEGFSNVQRGCTHVIWEVRDTKHGLIQKFEYQKRFKGYGYGGKYTVERLSNY